MEEYYFLFFLGLVWTIFAVVQDMKNREVANWLTFSLIGFALAYRGFYSSFSGNWMFFVYGLLGLGFFMSWLMLFIIQKFLLEEMLNY